MFSPITFSGDTIMCDVSTIIRQRQASVRRELDRRGISLKALSFDSGIPYPTLLSYFPREGSEKPAAAIPMAAVYALCGHAPADLLSLLLPDGFQIVRASEEIDHDTLAEIAGQYCVEMRKATHPESPGGREISECEDRSLRSAAAKLKLVA